ncbi:Anti-sigma factor N-terminus [Desulfotomaculum arcticum]|uniref:Anti-sigma factor N-terminus n=1 Tax=Desulfotruncus arcticus DSM 17038 TaxID=1121424 RepID=A0A1I2SLX0_9FIRM|nr:anti-sigma factor domain-containing protein [Desulfotruncus arcticus]SFG50851.1 Anti-sigma factor N-terminus [Desulfotomaculum arcticum] [Desulfotruncus arcticus DSM 17038]
MAPGRGMVMEIKGKHCIVLTNDGRFLKVPLPREGTDVGREVTVRSLSLASFKPLMAVASLLVAVLAWFVFQMLTPVAAAYVAIDINPSIELGVDKKDIVISAKGLNQDGELLLQNINLNKQPLEECLRKIIDQAIQSRYLSPEKDNLIVATVTPANQPWGGKASINVDEIYDTMRQPINACGLETELVVSETEPKVFKEAEKIGTTPGRYIIQQEAAKKGIKINDQELRERKIRELETSKHINAAECIQNANPGAVLGKGNQPYAKLQGMKNSSQQRNNKSTDELPKNNADKPGKDTSKGSKVNQTTALPGQRQTLFNRDSETKQQGKQVFLRSDKQGSWPDNNNDTGKEKESKNAEMKNPTQGKSQDKFQDKSQDRFQDKSKYKSNDNYRRGSKDNYCDEKNKNSNKNSNKKNKASDTREI